MVVGGGVCNRPDELALKEVELPGSSRSGPPGGRLLCRATHRSARTGGRRAWGRGAGYKAAAAARDFSMLVALSLREREKKRSELNQFALANVTGLRFPLFLSPSLPPRAQWGPPSRGPPPPAGRPPGRSAPCRRLRAALWCLGCCGPITVAQAQQQQLAACGTAQMAVGPSRVLMHALRQRGKRRRSEGRAPAPGSWRPGGAPWMAGDGFTRRELIGGRTTTN